MSKIIIVNNKQPLETWKLLEKPLCVVLYGYIYNRCYFVNFFLDFKRTLRLWKHLVCIIFLSISGYVFTQVHIFFEPLETFSLKVCIFAYSRLVFGSWRLDKFFQALEELCLFFLKICNAQVLAQVWVKQSIIK